MGLSISGVTMVFFMLWNSPQERKSGIFKREQICILLLIHISGSPAIADEVVYFGTTASDTHLYTLDVQTGEEKWKLKVSGGVFTSPAVVDGIVYFGSAAANSYFYAVDVQTMQEVWKFATESAVLSSPAIAAEAVYFGSSKYLYGVDIETGQELWKFQAEDEVFTPPVISDGVAYVGSYDTNIYAIR